MNDQSEPITSGLEGTPDLQAQLDAAQRELATTKAMLRLAELRLNAALGMPDEQLARCVRAADERTDKRRSA